MALSTKFAPAERSPDKEILDKFNEIKSNAGFSLLFNAVSGICAVLDEHRQIIFVNQEYLDLLGIDGVDALLGKRPGESVGCIHADSEPGGCGSADGCRYCGAVNAILESRRLNEKVSRETRLTVKTQKGDVSFDLLVSASPFDFEDKKYTVMTLKDISSEKRLQTFERIFFHDTINLASGINRAMQVLERMPDKNSGNDIIKLSERASSELLDDIGSFRQLKLAENGELSVSRHAYDALEIITHAADLMRHLPSAEKKTVLVTADSVQTMMMTDRSLLLRVMINMIKNALEAANDGDTVTAGVDRKDAGKVRLYVTNPGVMKDEVQLQVFQRSFSTKGNNRGLGTYSMKLLGEKYLGGTVGFTSDESNGTVFFIEIEVE